MAGKFLSIEEAAAYLGKSPEEVRQLVERRQLSALRDTAGPKFRIEELDRYREEAAEEAAAHDSEGPDGVHAEISGTAGSADAAKEESGLSLDGLELDLDDSAEASLQIEEPATESSSQPVTGKTDKAPIGGSDDELAMASGIELDDLQLGSDSVESGGQQAAAADEVSLVLGVDLEETSNQDAFTNTGSDDSLVIDAGEQADARPTTAGEDQASLVIGDDIEEAPADGPQTIVGASDSLVIGDDEPAAVKPTSTSDDPASLVLGDDLDESPAGGPQTLVGADDSLASGIEDSGPAKSENIAEAASLVAGDDIELSGLDMSLAGSLSGIELGDSDPAGGQAAGGSAVQGGSIGGSFGSDIDLESLVASSAIASDAKAKQSAVEDSLAGSDLFADDISVAEPEGAEGSGILVDSGSGSGASDVGSAISGGSGVFIEGGINLEGDDVKPWDVDLGEFMNDVEEDADAATMLGGNGEFDLDAEATADDPSQSAELASESQVGGNSSFFEKSQGPADSSFFDQPEGGPTPLSEMPSSSMLGPGLGTTKFTGWQVTGLICCSLLLLFGGLLTFDLVRTIGSPNDMPLANPIVGGLAGVFGWN